MKNVTYSIAKRNDLIDISNLFKNTIRNVNKRDYSPQEIIAWSQGAENIENWHKRIDTHHFIIAKMSNVLVGMACIDKDAYLDVIYIHHEYQGNGIASELLRQMEEAAKEMGYKYITSDVSITAKPFFLYKGYKMIRPQLILCRGVVLRNYNVRKSLL